MTRVLIVITTAFVSYGGLTTVMMNYYRAMNRDGLQIDFASVNEVGDELKSELHRNHSEYYRLPDRKRKLPLYVRALYALSKEYDIVHIHSNSATATIELLVAKLAGVSIRIVHNHSSSCTHKLVSSMLKAIFNRLYTTSIACSKQAGEWLFGKDNFIILNNAIDVKRYSYDAEKRRTIRRKYGISDEDIVIGHVGKMAEWKNHEYLIEIFSCLHDRIPNIKLLLVGDGVLREQLEETVKRKLLENYVIFAGMQDDASFFYSAFDVFVFPSLWEGLPLSLVEAQVAGLRCCVSDKVTKEVDVAGKLVFLSCDETVDKWCDQIVTIMEYDRQAESEHNIRLIKENGYDIETEANRLRGLYIRKDRRNLK